jgi:L-alanine-DL-glutamate epimerase-like enolase superfamily enzyme
MTGLKLTVTSERWPLRKPFRISGVAWTEMNDILVTVNDGSHSGRGEAQGVYYHGETPESMAAQIEAARAAIESGISRDELRALMPLGGARNAVDGALWELEARQTGRPVWALAGLEAPRPLLTTWTVGGDAPDAMAREASVTYADARAIKLKLMGDGDDVARVMAVREARPDVWLGVDANQGLDRARLEAMLPALIDADVSLIEQPVPVGRDAELDGLASPIPLAADESVQGLTDLSSLEGRYQVVNIKLDKCGGLTEGLAMARIARVLGFDVMVGNMTGTSLAMAPSFVVGQLCDIVDLDGPLLLAKDRAAAVTYEDGRIDCSSAVWGPGAEGRQVPR